MSGIPDVYKDLIIGAAVDDLRRFEPIGWYSAYGGVINGKKLKKRSWISRQKVAFWLYMHKKSMPYADCCGGYCE